MKKCPSPSIETSVRFMNKAFPAISYAWLHLMSPCQENSICYRTIQKKFPIWISRHRFSLCFIIIIVHLHCLGCFWLFAAFFPWTFCKNSPKSVRELWLWWNKERTSNYFLKFWTVIAYCCSCYIQLYLTNSANKTFFTKPFRIPR